MKKKYLIPETTITWVSFETSILSNVEDISIRVYGSGAGEDDEDFWG